MGNYIARRLVQMIPVVFGITLLLFFMLRLIPGDPASVMLGERATDEAVQRLNHELGLDQPIYIQSGHFDQVPDSGGETARPAPAGFTLGRRSHAGADDRDRVSAGSPGRAKEGQ